MQLKKFINRESEVRGRMSECDKQENKVISDKMSYTVGGILTPQLFVALEYRLLEYYYISNSTARYL